MRRLRKLPAQAQVFEVQTSSKPWTALMAGMVYRVGMRGRRALAGGAGGCAMPRLMRRAMNVLLLPLALLMVVLEDVVWAGALFVLRALRAAAPVRAVEAWLGTLSGYAALPVFLVLEVVGFAGKIWAIGLVASGHPVAGLEAYVVIRLGSTLLAVFVYQACAPALLRIGWFAWLVGWVHAARDWAMRLVRPMLEVVRRLLRRGRGRLALRWLAIRRHLRERR